MVRYSLAVFAAVIFAAASGCRNNIKVVPDSAMDRSVMAARVTAHLKAARSIEVPSEAEILTLIWNEQFSEFEALSKKYEAAFETNPIYESALTRLYDALKGDNERLLPKLNRWVETKPSYISYGARGIYNVRRGYWARGSNSTADTSELAFRAMSILHEEAGKDLRIAIEKNGRFSPAYCALIDIERAVGNSDGTKKILDDAVRKVPQAYCPRYAYLVSLRPRWGGSYEAMQAYADSIDRAAQLNPRIWGLKAEVSGERAYSAYLDKDFDRALQYYSEALSYGDRLEFLKKRGWVYLETKHYDLARGDFSRFVTYDKSDSEVNSYIAFLNAVPDAH